MSRPGIRPLTDDQLRAQRLLSIRGLPGDARQALQWLRRGYLASSPLLPLPLRRGLLRLGGVEIGRMVYGLERCWFESPQVRIGAQCVISSGCRFEGHGRIDVGRDCFFGPELMILTSRHPIDDQGAVSREPEYADVVIGDGCWLGARAIIMPGVHIHAGTVVGAGAIVTHDCGPGGVFAGVPARRLR